MVWWDCCWRCSRRWLWVANFSIKRGVGMTGKDALKRRVGIICIGLMWTGFAMMYFGGVRNGSVGWSVAGLLAAGMAALLILKFW